MASSRDQLIRETFVELADTLASEYDVVDFLQILVERCAQILDVTTGGVMIEDPKGNLRLVAATSEDMKALEQLETNLKEGPCLDAYRQVRQVVAEDLRERTDIWPQVAPRAVAMGLLAVYAFPLRRREDCIGALNLYREETGAFRAGDIRLAQAFADVAAIGILQERRVASAEVRAAQLQHALDSRVLIEQAKGILAERGRSTPQKSFELIRKRARDSGRTVRDVCQELVDGGDPFR